MKKILIFVLSICLLLTSLCFFSGCGRAPKTEEIYDRVVELIEDSYTVNTVFYGAGLPVYHKGSFYADFMDLYQGDSYTKGYEKVSAYSMFISQEDIQRVAEQVYSKAYLNDVIYPACFEGYAIDNGLGDMTFSYSKYLDNGQQIYMIENPTVYYTDLRIYDYASMKVVAPSNSKACYVEICSWFASDPEDVIVDRLRLVKQEDGLWYLDSFTG